MSEVMLPGCTAEPLMSYLKALGVLRLVSEQADRGARAAWRAGTMVLRSTLDEAGLAEFFLSEYRPTPIVVPWSGTDFFGVDEKGDAGPYLKKQPTGTKVIEAFLASEGERLASYRAMIRRTLAIMREEGIRDKKALEDKKVKSRFLASLRSQAGDELVEWIDAAAVIESDRANFNLLVGSGGGNDGNTHFSDNFMQNLWEVLPEFAVQRKGASKPMELLRSALFDEPAAGLAERTGALFDSGAVGGPNADAGFEGKPVLNPWNFILGLEGTLCFAGAAARRLRRAAAGWAFPFMVTMSAAGYGTAVEAEQGQREIWMPLWERFAGYAEIRLVLAEGRAQVGSRAARSGSDFARAITSFGVDAGIRSFTRYGFVKGRVGGENYLTAVPLGRFEVRHRDESALLLEVDGWLERFGEACGEETAPPRFPAALRRIERAVVEFSRFGGRSRMQEILRALGQAERQLAEGERFRSNDRRTIAPIGPLSPDWVAACDDGSAEFRIAAAIASIHGRTDGKAAELRTDMEPVKEDGRRLLWQGGNAGWGEATLAEKLLHVLERRQLEGRRQGLSKPPLNGRSRAWLADVSAFLWGLCDERAIEELLWGLILVDRRREWPDVLRPPAGGAPPLPRCYALIKLLFLPTGLQLKRGDEPFEIASEEEIPALLRAGNLREACRRAIRRLRASGLVPSVPAGEELDPGVEPLRIGAGLLIPILETRELARLVLRPVESEEE